MEVMGYERIIHYSNKLSNGLCAKNGHGMSGIGSILLSNMIGDVNYELG